MDRSYRTQRSSGVFIRDLILCAMLAVPAAGGPDPFVQRLDGTTLKMTLVPAPVSGGDDARTIWMSTTEVTWDWFDAFVYGLDEPAIENEGPDALTRPTQPYIAMDRGFGRAGFPAISMTHKNAEAFCEWLSARTGRSYRLPTVAEWLAACAASGIDAYNLDKHAWHRGNSKAKTQQVGSKAPDANGLHDLLGNAAEWATDEDGKPVVLGGSYLTPANDLACSTLQRPSPDWNASDPQFPPSEWWLADAGFVGFRVVLEMNSETTDSDAASPAKDQDAQKP